MFEGLGLPFLSFIKVFLMLIETENGDSDKEKFKFDFLIRLRIQSLVSLASILSFYCKSELTGDN